MRRKLSGHWGGNDSIEKVYGQSLRKRKDKILEYILDGYKPGIDKEFNDRSQQTEISLMNDVFSDRKDSTPFSVEIDEKPPSPPKGQSKSMKKTFSEIYFIYEKKRLTCNIFHLLKKRCLQIPLKILKRQSMRIIISPPFIELYLGQDQIYPFDLRNVLAQKQKCPFEELKTEGIQRMPEVITLQSDQDWRFAEFDQNIPRAGTTVLETAEDEDFIFQDRYNYLPIGIQNKRSKKAFNFKKLTYIEPTEMKCLQKNLTNINHPERFVYETDISEGINYFPSTKSIICKSIKSFLSGTASTEYSRNKYKNMEDDLKTKETTKSCDRFESILPSSEPSVISCVRTYDSHGTPHTLRRDVSDDNFGETDYNEANLQSNIKSEAGPETSGYSDITDVKHKRLKSSLKRRLTENFVDFTPPDLTLSSLEKGLSKKKKKSWFDTLKDDSVTTDRKMFDNRTLYETRESVKERTLFNKPGCESALTLTSLGETDKGKCSYSSEGRNQNEQKHSRSKSILKRGKKLYVEDIDHNLRERRHVENTRYKTDGNKEKEHILADLSLEDKFEVNHRRKNMSNVNSNNNRQSTVNEGKNLIEMMFGGSLFRSGRETSSKELVVEPSTSKPKSWDKGKEVLDDTNTSLKQNDIKFTENGEKLDILENTDVPKSKKTEDKKTKSSLKSIPPSRNDGLSEVESLNTDDPRPKENSPTFYAHSSRIFSHENNELSPRAERYFSPTVEGKHSPAQNKYQGEHCEKERRTPGKSVSPKRNNGLKDSQKDH